MMCILTRAARAQCAARRRYYYSHTLGMRKQWSITYYARLICISLIDSFNTTGVLFPGGSRDSKPIPTSFLYTTKRGTQCVSPDFAVFLCGVDDIRDEKDM